MYFYYECTDDTLKEEYNFSFINKGEDSSSLHPENSEKAKLNIAPTSVTKGRNPSEVLWWPVLYLKS